jgi:outer membrane protein TolC
MVSHQNFMLKKVMLVKMRKNNYYVILFVFCFLSIQLDSQNFTTLSFDNYVDNILANNPLSKKAENIRTYGKLQNKAARGNYDPSINAAYENKYFDGKNYYTNLNSEIKQQLFTSQYLKFGYDYGIGNYTNPESYTPTNGLSYLGLEVGLLQGLMIDYRRADVLKSKEYINYYNAERNIQINDLLFESSQKYFDWLFTTKQLALNNYFMDIANQRLRGIEALANIGERATIDTIEAAIFYQTRLLDLQNSIIENQKMNNDLASFNWQENNPSNLQINYQPVDSLDNYYIKAKNNFLKTLYQDSSNNPVIAKYNSFQNVIDIENRLKKEMIKPKLNVNYNFLSNSSSQINPALSNNSYKWGANVSFPLLLRNSRNEFKMGKINSQNNSFELKNKNNELDFKINALKQTINILIQQLENAERSTKYNRQLVEAEKLKFANGESSLFILNARESKWLDSELKLAEYKLKFIKTVINIIYLKGNLNYKI